jgi:hypothetical protein
MAFQLLPGCEDLWIPHRPPIDYAPSFNESTIDATGEKVAFTGRVKFPARTGNKDIQRVHIRFGTVTKAGGSGLTISLQNPLNTTQPGTGDETQDQTVAVANGDATFASNTWHRSGTLSADRTVAYNEELSVVVEFDGSGRLGADSVQITGLLSTASTAGHKPNYPSWAHKTGGSWATASRLPCVLLEFDDGTYGTLDSAFPVSAVNSHAFKQDTGTADEYALRFQLPFPFKVDGGWALVEAVASADFDTIMYDGTTPMTNGSLSVEAGNLASAGTTSAFLPFTFPGEVQCAANTTYRLAFKPTQTAANITLRSFDLPDNGYFAAHAFGVEGYLSTRLNEGAWSDTTTRRLFAGIRISSLDDGAGAGGGGSAYIIGG